MEFKQIILKIDPLANIHYIDRYLKILSCLIKSNSGSNEKHHILPRSIFPKYIKSNKNIIAIPTRWHYLVHWLLIKIFRNEKYRNQMSHAFNNMKRVIKHESKKGVLYEMSRKYISSAVSTANLGRKRDTKFKLMISERNLGMMVVRDKKGNQFKARTDDPKVISGEWVYYRNGYKHTKETIAKMSMNSGIKGKTPCYNDKNEVKYFIKDKIPAGWKKGQPPEILKERRLNRKSLRWYNDGKNNTRISEGDVVPYGFVRGRLKKGKFQGFNDKKEKNERN